MIDEDHKNSIHGAWKKEVAGVSQGAYVMQKLA